MSASRIRARVAEAINRRRPGLAFHDSFRPLLLHAQLRPSLARALAAQKTFTAEMNEIGRLAQVSRTQRPLYLTERIEFELPVPVDSFGTARRATATPLLSLVRSR